MDRPDWVPAPAWGRLEAALRGQPGHAGDALSDLEAAVERWACVERAALLDRFAWHAERGAPLPGAFIAALCDLVEGDG